MLFYNGRPYFLVPDDDSIRDINSKNRAIDLMIARDIFKYRIRYNYLSDGNYIKIEYADPDNGVYQEVPFWTTNTDTALNLFVGRQDIELKVRQIFPPSFSHPSGEWRVGYIEKSISGPNIEYLPGSGSYYNFPEAITRAWLVMQDVCIIQNYWDRTYFNK